MYLIWSYEHNAWWGPEGRGYVDTIAEAGRYSFQAAAEITVGHIPPGEEVAIPDNMEYAQRFQNEEAERIYNRDFRDIDLST